MKTKLKSPSEYPSEIHQAIIKHLLSGDAEYSYTGLHREIRYAAQQINIRMGVNRAKLFAKYYYTTANYVQQCENGLYLIKPI